MSVWARRRKFEVLPGPHGLAVRLEDDVPGWRLYSVRSLVVCFVARPGHTYATRPVYAGRIWRRATRSAGWRARALIRSVDGAPPLLLGS